MSDQLRHVRRVCNKSAFVAQCSPGKRSRVRIASTNHDEDAKSGDANLIYRIQDSRSHVVRIASAHNHQKMTSDRRNLPPVSAQRNEFPAQERVLGSQKQPRIR